MNIKTSLHIIIAKVMLNGQLSKLLNVIYKLYLYSIVMQFNCRKSSGIMLRKG